MKFTLALLAFVVLFAAGSVSPQSRARRVTHNPVVQRNASKEAIETFVALFEYATKAAPDITGDRTAQDRFLAKPLRTALLKNKEMWDGYIAKNPDSKRDGADNSSLLGVWNQPTTYSIVSGREYDYRNAQNPNAFRTIIDVFYEWGKENTLDNQYPGTRNLHSFIFIFEQGSWKLEDIYIYDDEFTSPRSLRQDLEAPIE